LFAAENKFGEEPNTGPSILPPPIFSNGGATPLSALGGAAPRVNVPAGPSDFTRLIQSGQAPVVPPPAAPASAAKADAGAPAKRTLPIGLIVVINVVLLIAIILIVVVWRKPTSPLTRPKPPAMPTAPALKAPRASAPAAAPAPAPAEQTTPPAGTTPP
jgi:hypothetical protein